jgi:hypothetical protein
MKSVFMWNYTNMMSGNNDTAAIQGAMISPNLFSIVSSCVYYFQHSKLTRYSQPSVPIKISQQNAVSVSNSAVLSCSLYTHLAPSPHLHYTIDGSFIFTVFSLGYQNSQTTLNSSFKYSANYAAIWK